MTRAACRATTVLKQFMPSFILSIVRMSDLPPRLAVRAVPPLRDHAFEIPVARQPEQLDAVLRDVVRVQHCRCELPI
jgi:hypothetical protein